VAINRRSVKEIKVYALIQLLEQDNGIKLKREVDV
jgi:hypothetical protein